MSNNPKLANTSMIECRPQTGNCPLNCLECFYNKDTYYESKNEPTLPTLEEARGRLVRCNDGLDSNVGSSDVIRATRDYPAKFYNTSIARLFFPAPVVLTINGLDTDTTYIVPDEIEGDIDNLMAIRFRLNLWNIDLCEAAINSYRHSGITAPFLLTDMRYTNINNIPEAYREFYEKKKHINNTYYRVTSRGLSIMFSLMRYNGVYWCGNPFNGSILCSNCFLCEHFYVASQSKRLYKQMGSGMSQTYKLKKDEHANRSV